MRDRARAIAVLALGASLLSACDATPSAGSEVFFTDIQASGVPSELLAGVTELAISRDREIILLLTGESRILVLDSIGRPLRTLGREGAGPGELRYPDMLLLAGDTIRVANRPNARIETYLISGAHLGADSLPPSAMAGLLAYGPGPVFLATTGGARDALAVLLADGSERRLGSPVRGARFPMDLAVLKQEIAAGVVPPELQNLARPVLAADRSSWLVVGARGEVQRYAPDGRLLWASQIGDSLLEVERRRFFDANRRERDPRRMHALSPFEGPAQAMGGSLWVLLRSDDDDHARFAVFGPAGGAPMIVTMQGTGGGAAFTLDAERKRVYVLTREPARLLHGAVPPSLAKAFVAP